MPVADKTRQRPHDHAVPPSPSTQMPHPRCAYLPPCVFLPHVLALPSLCAARFVLDSLYDAHHHPCRSRCRHALSKEPISEHRRVSLPSFFARLDSVLRRGVPHLSLTKPPSMTIFSCARVGGNTND